MQDKKQDKLCVHGLCLSVEIGCYPEEKNIREDILLDFTIFTDIRKAAEKDSLILAVDYDTVSQILKKKLEASSYNLVETLATAAAKILLSFDNIEACNVLVKKPGAPPSASHTSIEIFRTAQTY